MLDLILSTSDSAKFHAKNVAKHPSHYPLHARAMPASAIAAIQRNYGAAMWFNPLVNLPSVTTRPIKYGVIETADLIEDLLHWKHFYVAGRMHKPVGVIKGGGDEIEYAMAVNSMAAKSSTKEIIERFFSAARTL